MTPPLSSVNIAAFVLQITVIVSAGAVLLRVFRIDAPGAVLAYWRILLLVCLTLPFLQPWTIVDVPVSTAAIETTTSAPSEAAVPVSTQSPPAAGHFGGRLLIVLMAGIAARLLWLAVGAYGLWRLRRRSAPLDPLPDPVGRAQARVAVRVRFYLSDQVSGPITFGLIRPAIVVPAGICAMPAHVQEAIVS